MDPQTGLHTARMGEALRSYYALERTRARKNLNIARREKVSTMIFNLGGGLYLDHGGFAH